MLNFKQKKLFLPLVVVLALPLLFSGCNRNEPSVQPIERTEVMMGTPVNVKIYDKRDEAILDKVFARVKDIEDKMSINLEKSEVIDINNAAGKSYVKVSDDTFNVIKKGDYYSNLSGGKFDITIGPLVKLWGIGTDHAKVPAANDIKAVLPLINYKNILFNETDKSIMLKNKGMMIDLGGIAKGWTADEIEKILKENGVKHAIINLGGNVLVMGGKTDSSPFRIGIQDPTYKTRGELVGTIELRDMTIVTSGVYERYFEENGKKYHHILDHKTGYPVENNLLSVSIITKNSGDADALSTSVFAMGLNDGMNFVKNLKDVDAIFITNDLKVYTTPGVVNIFKITNSEFVLQK